MNRERMVETFMELVKIDSVSGNEEEMHGRLIEILKSFDLDVVEDDSKEKTGLGGNNIIATLRGTQKEKEPILFSCHTDTVAPGTGIVAIEKEDYLVSAGDTILGADDKAGIAILIESLHMIKEEEIATGDIEFVFTPGEEIGLIGASALDMSKIESNMGYVLDNAGDVGNVIVASPTIFMYEATITGKAAHAGLEPEKGISAVSIFGEALKNIPNGRLDEKTTMNIGSVHGGEATNIVMDSLTIKGEIRAISTDVATSLMNKVKNELVAAAEKYGGSVDLKSEKKATGFYIDSQEPVMQLLTKAVKAIGRQVGHEISGGGSDANIFNEKGKSVVNLSIGYDEIHTINERVSIDEMEQAVRLVLELIKNAPSKHSDNHA
ncbi:M20/M25/M40 family metallo-hydrolase [Enterococcus casseliflavus]|nr:M20/M25/M40 family metallo-hydrolase [Enterococcus casseliflavus]